MTLPTPPDADARETIRTQVDRTLFVEAGAGTGKTTALVARIVTLVASGRKLDAVAAITFTENAAAELRHRIRLALADAAATAGAESGLFTAALASLDDAAFSTLHGFASRLLAEHPLEAGLPVGFTVMDDVTAALDRDRWWDRAVDDSLGDATLIETWRIALALGLGPSSLRKIADAMHQGWDLIREVDPVPTIPPWDLGPAVKALQAAHAYADGGPEGDKLTEHLRGRIGVLLRDLGAEDDDLGRAVVLAEASISTKYGQAGKWAATGVTKPTVTDLLDEAKGHVDDQLTRVRTACLTRLVAWLGRVVKDAAQDRRGKGELYFHDLLVLARDLLRDHEVVRQRLRERWPVIMIDEFQDTDPLQVEIVHLLASLGQAPTWDRAEVEPGRLFFVGDPKQSIYRFRRADIELYQRVREGHPPADRPRLTCNFRSRPSIIATVNTALGELMRDKPDQVDFQPLDPHRERGPDGDGPTVLLLGGPTAGNMDIVRDLEARHVAGTCRRVVGPGGWQVEKRPARFSDIAILVPTRTSLSTLESELQRADVPYRVESRSLVWDTDVVRELLAILEAVADPGDHIAVVTALRSAAFGCTDTDLLAWHEAGGRWDYRRTPPEGSESSTVAAALTALRRYHDCRLFLPLNQLADLLVRERRMAELTSGLARPRDHWRRLRFVVDQTRAFLDAGGSQLVDFVRWAREQAERGADAVETVVNEPDDDAVRILTIHSAKGLEFPVTILAGLNVDDAMRDQTLWSANGLEAGMRSFETAGWATARAAEVARQQAEAVRLLYVAMTRARDHLVVSLHHKAPKNAANNHAARLFALLDTLTGPDVQHEPSVPTPGAPGVAVAAEASYDPRAREAFREERDRLLERVRRAVPVSASSLPGEDEAGEPADELTLQAEESTRGDDPVRWRAPVTGGATLGSAVHRTLELVDFAERDPVRIRTVVDAVTAELGAAHLAAETTRRVRLALDSELIRSTVGRRVWKEVPISAPVDGRFVEGYIDLVVETADGLLVVDYKTDSAATAEAVAEKTAHYGPQLRAYSGALQAATGRTVIGATLLFLGGQSAQAHDVGRP